MQQRYISVLRQVGTRSIDAIHTQVPLHIHLHISMDIYTVMPYPSVVEMNSLLIYLVE